MLHLLSHDVRDAPTPLTSAFCFGSARMHARVEKLQNRAAAAFFSQLQQNESESFDDPQSIPSLWRIACGSDRVERMAEQPAEPQYL
jgi:hypothetical protein